MRILAFRAGGGERLGVGGARAMVVVICEQPPCRVMCAAPQKRKIKFMLKVIGLALAVAIVASFSGAATPAQAGTYTPIAMTMVRSDIPSIEAYWSDHNTYVGITVAKLRAYDSGLSSIEIDWEVELAVVIGRGGADIKRGDARRHVFGYMVLNDVSARDIQAGWGGQYFKGKSLDRSCPTGPWIVTADEIDDPQSLGLTLSVNGVVKQASNTGDMIYPVDAIIEWVSKGMTLPAGSIIATGTPDGVGFARNPPEFLRPGDVMESEVERIGVLRNRIVS